MRKHVLTQPEEIRAFLMNAQHAGKPQLILVQGDEAFFYRDRNASMDAEPYLHLKNSEVQLTNTNAKAELIGQIFRDYELLLLASSCHLTDIPEFPDVKEPIRTFNEQQTLLLSLPDPEFVWFTS